MVGGATAVAAAAAQVCDSDNSLRQVDHVKSMREGLGGDSLHRQQSSAAAAAAAGSAISIIYVGNINYQRGEAS